VKAVGDALQFLLILGLEMRPEDGSAGVAKETPIALDVMRQFDLVDMDDIFNFECEQIASRAARRMVGLLETRCSY